MPAKARADRKNVGWFYWPERVKIEDASAEETQTRNGDTHIKLEVATRIQAMDPSGDTSVNPDRKVSLKGRLNYDAWNKFQVLSESEKKSVLKESGPGTFGGQVKMHRGTVARMTQLFRILGLYDGGDITEELYAHVFPSEGTSPVVGTELDVEVKQGPNEKDDKWPEIAKLMVPDNIAVPTEATPNGALTL